MEPPNGIGSIRALGYRLTFQREQIYYALERLGHATPDQVSQVLPETAGVSLSTVYRVLDLLEKIGLVHHTHVGHNATYHIGGYDDHVHLVCRDCAVIYEADPRLLDPAFAAMLRDYQFAADVRQLVIYGRCKECAPGPCSSSGM
ncbi:Fur family transcriptional regulator [Nonomuraea turcica]|uniref:Fur family transcriptional regulator n=1 Tax=Nonomuraea sp. G32 TaxID=3067274 RepID=UPI00273C6AE6|nr:Fur family transcriptional regulator [Nonomuraea sp. G32]MDP4501815.1 Fur family transcriptional regulator [Nonomuraea sp. G32]